MLVLLLVAPLLTALYGPLDLSFASAAQPGLDNSALTGTNAAAPGQTRAAPVEGVLWRWVLESVDFLNRNLPLVVMAWLFGVVVVSCRWLQGCWWVRRIRTVKVEPVDPALEAVLEYLKCRFEIQRPVRLVRSALAEVPMVVGWLRPVILLPASALTGLTLEQLESIIAHELAHVRRCDYLVNAFQNAVETLMFYHPAVWWVSRCVREEREHCCDDLVVRVCSDRVVYARALFRLEELRGTPARLAFAASGGSLLQRMRRLLGGAPEAWPVTVREFSGLTLLAIGCVLLLTGACMLFGTQTYSGAARIRIEHQQPIGVPISGQEKSSFHDPYFIQTEFEVIQSQVILGRVIEELDLNREWGKRLDRRLKTDETMELLKRQMDLRPVRNTAIIEIRVYDEDPSQAAKIANTIARVYADYRTGQRAAGQGIDALVARLKDLDASVRSAQSNVDFLRKELSIRDDDVSSESEPSMLLTAETLRRIEALRLESQAEYVQTRTLVEKLKALPPEELAQAIPTAGIQDQNLTELLQKQATLEQRLIATEKEFGPQYTDVVKLRAQSTDLKEKIRTRADGILRGLEAKVSSTQQGLSDLKEEVDKAMNADIQKANASRPYLQAKQNLEEELKFRQMLYLKIASEKTDLQLPKSSAVEIVDQAFVPSRPYSPNRSRAFALMISGLLLSLIGLVLTKSARNRAMTAIAA